MTGPRPEHTPRPGATWETRLVRTEEYVPECAASVRGACLAEALGSTACAVEDGECIHAAPDPRPNRATRRAAARKQTRRA